MGIWRKLKNQLDTIEHAISEFKLGKMLVVIDDKDREIKAAIAGEQKLRQEKGSLEKSLKRYEKYDKQEEESASQREGIVALQKDIGVLAQTMNEGRVEDISQVKIPDQGTLAIGDRFNLLKRLNEELLGRLGEFQGLEKECIEIIKQVREEGVNTAVYEEELQAADLNGLKVLRAILGEVNEKVGLGVGESQVGKQIQQCRNQLQLIRDLRIRTFPLKLLQFAETIIKEATTPQQRAAADDMALKVIKAIQYSYFRRV